MADPHLEDDKDRLTVSVQEVAFPRPVPIQKITHHKETAEISEEPVDGQTAESNDSNILTTTVSNENAVLTSASNDSNVLTSVSNGDTVLTSVSNHSDVPTTAVSKDNTVLAAVSSDSNVLTTVSNDNNVLLENNEAAFTSSWVTASSPETAFVVPTQGQNKLLACQLPQDSIAVTDSDWSSVPSFSLPTRSTKVGHEIPPAATGKQIVDYAAFYPVNRKKIPNGDPNSIERYKPWDLSQFPPRDRGEENNALQALVDKRQLERTYTVGLPLVEEHVDAYVKDVSEFNQRLEQNLGRIDALWKAADSDKNMLEGFGLMKVDLDRTVMLRRIPITPLEKLIRDTWDVRELELDRDLRVASSNLHSLYQEGAKMVRRELEQDSPRFVPTRVKPVDVGTESETIPAPADDDKYPGNPVANIRNRYRQVKNNASIIQESPKSNDADRIGEGEDEVQDLAAPTTAIVQEETTAAPSLDPIRCPPWFRHLERKNLIRLRSDTEDARYAELVQLIGGIEYRILKRTEVNTAHRRFWHDPNPQWPNEKWKTNGGWFRCRSGEEATFAENMCRLCHSYPTWQEEERFESVQGKTFQEKHDWLMAKIDEARQEALERDKTVTTTLIRANLGSDHIGTPRELDWQGLGELSLDDVGLW